MANGFMTIHGQRRVCGKCKSDLSIGCKCPDRGLRKRPDPWFRKNPNVTDPYGYQEAEWRFREEQDDRRAAAAED